jgi:hypothetical protein
MAARIQRTDQAYNEAQSYGMFYDGRLSGD